MVSVKNDKKEYIEVFHFIFYLISQRTLEILPDAVFTHVMIIMYRFIKLILKVEHSYIQFVFMIWKTLQEFFYLIILIFLKLTHLDYPRFTILLVLLFDFSSSIFILQNSKVFPLLCQALQWEPSTWSVSYCFHSFIQQSHKEELLKEVYQRIPQYSFEKNCYYIQTADGVIENNDISAFFLPVPISTLLQQASSSSSTTTNPPHIQVPYLCFICLSNHHIV